MSSEVAYRTGSKRRAHGSTISSDAMHGLFYGGTCVMKNRNPLGTFAHAHSTT